MSDDNQDVEIELDPLGFAPRPDLYVRNLTPNTITFNMGKIRWSLPPWPSEDYEQPLPWTVARSSSFERLWDRKRVLVSIDDEFEYIITQLPENGTETPGSTKAFVFRQETPQSVTEITHNLNRNGPVLTAVFSLEGDIEYWNYGVEMVDADTVRLSFDDPITFVASIL